jgi:hypothetical protein
MKRIVLAAALTAAAVSAFAYDWPAADMQVVRTFGQRTAGAVLPGVEVQTLSPVLTAPENGDVVFVFRPGSQEVQNLPSALGGFVALAHDDNLRTVTSRIDPSGDETKRSFRRGEPLGQAEVQPGASESRHRLFVFDQQLSELVNPLLVFPQTVDPKAPLFFDVRAFPETPGQPVSLFGQGTLAVGYWNIHVEVSDPVTLFPAPGKEKGAEAQRGVYGIEAYLNGAEVFNTALDSIQERGGRWQVKGMSALLDDVLIQDQEWNLGQVFINQGTNILEVVVKDFKGNQTGKTFRVLGVR